MLKFFLLVLTYYRLKKEAVHIFRVVLLIQQQLMVC